MSLHVQRKRSSYYKEIYTRYSIKFRVFWIMIINFTDGVLLKDPIKYKRLVSILVYLTITIPNIIYPIRTLSQFIPEPHKSYWDTVIWILKYIKDTPCQGLSFTTNNNLNLRLFCDSNWGKCHATIKSVTRYYIFLDNSLISWNFRK